MLAVSILTLGFDVMIASKAEYMGYAPYSQKRKHSSGMAIQKHRSAWMCLKPVRGHRGLKSTSPSPHIDI